MIFYISQYIVKDKCYFNITKGYWTFEHRNYPLRLCRK